MQSQRWAWTHRHAVPMFVASLVALTISVAAAVAFLAFDTGGEGDTRADGGETPTSEPTPGGRSEETPSGADTTVDDECVVDTWRLTSYTEEDARGSAELVSGEPVFTFAGDGTGNADYPSGTQIALDAFGVNQTLDVSGEITYQYQVSGGTLEFVDQTSTVEIPLLSENFTLPEGPLDYTCDGETLTFADDVQSFELQRAG